MIWLVSSARAYILFSHINSNKFQHITYNFPLFLLIIFSCTIYTVKVSAIVVHFYSSSHRKYSTAFNLLRSTQKEIMWTSSVIMCYWRTTIFFAFPFGRDTGQFRNQCHHFRSKGKKGAHSKFRQQLKIRKFLCSICSGF